MQEMQIVVFSLNHEICGADTSQVQEIKRYQDVTKVPEMPAYVDGIINLRGTVVPVVNLNTKFDLGPTEITRKTKILITRVNEHPIGFIVNDVSEIMKLKEEDIEAAPDLIHKAGNTYLNSVGKKGDVLISILNLNRILADHEIDKIKDVQ